MFGEVGLQSHVSVVGRSHFLAVDIHIAEIDDASEVEFHTEPLPGFVGDERFAVPALAHRLEAACPATVLRPRLLKLEIVRQIHMPPLLRFLAGGKFPVEVPEHFLLGYELGQRPVTFCP